MGRTIYNNSMFQGKAYKLEALRSKRSAMRSPKQSHQNSDGSSSGLSIAGIAVCAELSASFARLS